MPTKPQISIAFPTRLNLPDDLLNTFEQVITAIVGGSFINNPPEHGKPIEAPPVDAPPTDLPVPSGTDAAVVGIIQERAEHYGIDPLLALVTAYHESGLNTHAIGDGGTSFGIYQLHRGGELGNLTADEAFDAYTNADVALSTMAGFGPASRYASPGSYAAAAQRPANPGAYAAAINSLYRQFGGTF